MKKIINLLILLSIFCLTTNAQDKIQFKLKPEIGSIYSYFTKTANNMEGEQALNVEMEHTIDLFIKDIKDDIITAEVTIKSFKLNGMAGTMPITFDSTKEPSNEIEEAIAAQFQNFLEGKKNIKFYTNGKIIESDFEGIENSPIEQRTIEMIIFKSPNNPISIGESWTSMESVSESISEQNIEYKFTEKTPEDYKFTTFLDLKENNEGMSGKINGQILIDNKSNMSKQISTEFDLTFHGNALKVITETKLLQVTK